MMNRPEHRMVRITEGFWKEQLDKIWYKNFLRVWREQ